MLERLFTRADCERSAAGQILERAAIFIPALRKHRKERAERLRQMRADLRAAGIERKASDPWDMDPITAQPAPPKPGTGPITTPDELGMVEDGFVRRRLSQLQPEHVQALKVYYGAIGARYELGDQPTDGDVRPRSDKPQSWGQLPRVFSLMHLTREGWSLIKKAGELLGRGLDMPDYEKLRVHLLMRERDIYEPLREDFACAELAAERMYEKACAAWNGTQR